MGWGQKMRSNVQIPPSFKPLLPTHREEIFFLLSLQKTQRNCTRSDSPWSRKGVYSPSKKLFEICLFKAGELGSSGSATSTADSEQCSRCNVKYPLFHFHAFFGTLSETNAFSRSKSRTIEFYVEAEHKGRTPRGRGWRGGSVKTKSHNFKLNEVREARSRLYRPRFLQVNSTIIRWKALDEIYQIYIPLHLSDRKISAKFVNN